MDLVCNLLLFNSAETSVGTSASVSQRGGRVMAPSRSIAAERCSSGRAAEPIATERAVQRAGDDADLPVAKTIEMIHGLGRRLRVVDVDAGDAEPRAELAAVDDRRAPRRHCAHELCRGFRQAMAE